MFKKTLFLPLLLIFSSSFAQDDISLISWNIKDFGQTKSEQELDAIAEVLRDVDIVALQEVVAGPAGAKAMASLWDILNRKGSKWDYALSDPTNSPSKSTERYAFLWKTSRVKRLGKARLVNELDSLVDREPYLINFIKDGKELYVLDFHSRPDSEKAKSEIAAIADYLKNSEIQNATLLAGDFNLDEKEPAFDGLKNIGFTPAISFQRTTLKTSCDENIYLHRSVDNIFYSPGIHKSEAHCTNLVIYCDNLASIRSLSDHLPIFMEFNY